MAFVDPCKLGNPLNQLFRRDFKTGVDDCDLDPFANINLADVTQSYNSASKDLNSSRTNSLVIEFSFRGDGLDGNRDFKLILDSEFGVVASFG